MSTSNTVRRAVRLALVTSAAAGAVITLPAWAADDTISEVVVTGSRIAQPNLTTTSPVTQVTAADITTQGVTRVEDLINQLPQAFAAQNATVANGSTGTATVDLRGLGSVRTLVLVDGRRMPYGGVTSDSAAPDLNMIPAPLVERVEVLTGGASAVYGSDAVSGVVNFIMKKNFEGIQVDGQYSFYQHENDYGGPGAVKLRQVVKNRAATNSSQFKLPSESLTDGDGRQGSIIMGVNSEDGRGNMTAYAVYSENNAILQSERDFSACTLGANPTVSFACGGSGTAFPGTFTQDFATNYTIQGNTFRPFVAATDQYNFGPLNHFLRPDQRFSLGANGHYELNEHADVYTQLMFTDDRSVAQIAPGGAFLDPGSISCNNPLLSAQQVALLKDVDNPVAALRTLPFCTPANIASDARTSFSVGRRNVEGGGRQQDFHKNTFRGVIGLKGDIVTGWTYDLSTQFSRVTVDTKTLNYFTKTRFNNSIDAVRDPATGNIVCRSVLDGTDTNCVPYNIFAEGQVTPEALAYLQAPGIQAGVIDQNVSVAAVTGDLGTIGFKLPTATEPVQIAFGVEQRRDKLENTTDALQAADELAGAGGAVIGISGSTLVNDIFAETSIPIIQDKPFAEQLGLDLAYRYSDYGKVTTDTYKLSGDWAPVSDIRFRASFQRAVRAANVVELFTAQGFNLYDLDGDPCGAAIAAADAKAGRAPIASNAECLASGVPLSNLRGTALDSPAGQYQRFQGGNPALKPEKSDTTSFGFVFTPSFVPGLSVTVDYYDIKIDDTISSYGAENTLTAFYANNDASALSRIHRDANGLLWVGDGNVDDQNINIGSLSTKGIDLAIAYSSLDIGAAGSLGFNLTGTYLDELIIDPGPGATPYDCKGFFAGQCTSGAISGVPSPEWRHQARVTWTTPINVDVSLSWRYFGEVEQFGSAPDRIDRKFSAENYFDLFGSWALMDNATVRLGINNVLDNDPQLSASVGTTGNGNTFPQTYDALGRFIFTGLTVKF